MPVVSIVSFSVVSFVVGVAVEATDNRFKELEDGMVPMAAPLLPEDGLRISKSNLCIPVCQFCSQFVFLTRITHKSSLVSIQ